MILHFEGDEHKTSKVKVTKNGKVWVYFTAIENDCKYRVHKISGEVQISPYWNKSKMWIENEE